MFYLSAILKSLYDKEFYSGLMSNSLVSGIKYILLISLLSAIPSALVVKSKLEGVFGYTNYNNAANYVSDIESQVPEIYYSKAGFDFDAKTIAEVNDRQGETILIIDPKAEITDFEQYLDKIIINNESVIFNYKNEELLVFSSAQIFDSFAPYFEPKATEEGGYKFKTEEFFTGLAAFFEASYIVFLIFSFIATSFKYLIWVFLVSNISFFLFYAKTKPFSLSSKTTFKITAFTLTPIAIFDMLRIILSLESLFMYPILISLIINISYIYFIASNIIKNLKFEKPL